MKATLESNPSERLRKTTYKYHLYLWSEGGVDFTDDLTEDVGGDVTVPLLVVYPGAVEARLLGQDHKSPLGQSTTCDQPTAKFSPPNHTFPGPIHFRQSLRIFHHVVEETRP
jgi:hypothetical protein